MNLVLETTVTIVAAVALMAALYFGVVKKSKSKKRD